MQPYQSAIAGKTILVTGGAGAIGTNLTRSLSQLGAKTVIVLDDMSAAYEWNVPSLPNVLFVNGSVTDETALKRVFQLQPDIVYHLAAFFANQNSVDFPQRDLMVNGLGTLLVYQYATMTKVSRMVYASSGCSIYGSSAPLPLVEDFMSMHLTTPYQITKMLGELYGNFFWHHYKLPVVKARFFNSYGPGEVPGQYRNVIPNFIYRAMKGLPLPFTGTGEETRDFTYVDDLVDGLLRAAYFEAAVGQEMNLASGREIRILDMAEQVNAMCGNRAGIQRAEPRVWDTKKRLLASVDRARTLLGYEPRMEFRTGLERTVQWFRDHWDAIDRDAEFPPGMSAAARGVTINAGSEEGVRTEDAARPGSRPKTTALAH
ncbi:MAG TPA: NAD-dependent epimerase/dehydratase family protein [Gemmatimonadaceae bacterium]|nr:NAD-dependent epimerase/dehydratase family protein [Gemmatimonadaceae bacterium]